MGDKSKKAIGERLIPDSSLRRELRHVAKGSLTTTALAAIKRLTASRLGIQDLTGLEHCSGLIKLSLRDNNITDVTPLAGLTQ